MLNRIIVLSLTIFAHPGHAAQSELARAECRELIRHDSDDDVAHRPGQDVIGNRIVAPADINPVEIFPAEDFDIDIDVALPGIQDADATGPDNFFATARAGWVDVRNLQGRMELDFNGQPLYTGDPGPASPYCTGVSRKTPTGR